MDDRWTWIKLQQQRRDLQQPPPLQHHGYPHPYYQQQWQWQQQWQQQHLWNKHQQQHKHKRESHSRNDNHACIKTSYDKRKIKKEPSSPPSNFEEPTVLPIKEPLVFPLYENIECSISIVENFIKYFQLNGEDQGGQTVFDFLNTNQSIGEMQMGDQQFNLGFDFLPPLAPAFGDQSLVSTTACDNGVPSPPSEFLDSLASSPLLSPSPVSVASPYSTESGIEDDADMEDCSTIDFMQTELNSGPAVNGFDVSLCSTTNLPVNLSPVSARSPGSPKSRSSNSSSTRHSRTSSQEKTTAMLASVQQELENLINKVSSSSQPLMKTEAFPHPNTCLVNVITSHAPAACPVSADTGTSQEQVLLSSVTPVGTTAVSATTSQSVSTALSKAMSSNVQKVSTTGKNSETPKLVVVEEPEENYRARYESEGCRGPIHGSSENSFPTIKVEGYTGQVWITVYLVTSSGQPHYHSIHGPGSTKVPCKEMKLDGGIPAVQVMVAPDTAMTAILDSLSIRRLRNWEGDRELKRRGIDPSTWKKERKEACLMFQAELPGKDNQPVQKLTCLSRVFKCSTSGPAGFPEVWWASLTEGSVEGGDELGLIGKKFQTGFRVRFTGQLPSGETWEKFAEVDKSKSHQGAAVLHVPPYCDQDIVTPVTVNVEVVTGSDRDPKYSDPIEFTYKPLVKNQGSMGLPLQTTGQDSNGLGGLWTNLVGGLKTVTAVQNGSVTTVQNGSVTGGMSDISSVINATTTVSAVPKQCDNEDWHDLCSEAKNLYQNGELTFENILILIGFIKRQDTVLLEAFRSSRNSGTLVECRTKFKQYLSGLLPKS